MQDDHLLSHEDNSRARWISLVAGIAFSFAAMYSMWSHGLRDWDWVQNAALALLAFCFAPNFWQDELLKRGWRARVFCLIYGILFGAWIGHENGWVLGGCIVAFFGLAASARESGWWSSGIKTPLGILQTLIAVVGVGSFIATASEWVPYVFIVALMLLLATEKKGRRSMRENLFRPRSVAWIVVLGLASYWSWREPSFASILALLATPILWFGNLLIHLSSGERPLALPHPQS
jgi:hypothetical protein